MARSPFTEEWLADKLAHGQVRVVGESQPRPRASAPPSPPPRQDRYKSETERRYAGWLTEQQQAGTIWQFWYEPCKGLYLAPKLSYTPDFLVEYTEGERALEFHEVKGAFIRPQDWNRLKQAAALYPCFHFVRAQWKDAQWHWQVVPAV